MAYDDPKLFHWDPLKDAANKKKHGIDFSEAATLFTSGVDYLEVIDVDHSHGTPRFIAIGPVGRGIIVVVWTEHPAGTTRIISARRATRAELALFVEHMGLSDG